MVWQEFWAHCLGYRLEEELEGSAEIGRNGLLKPTSMLSVQLEVIGIRNERLEITRKNVARTYLEL